MRVFNAFYQALKFHMKGQSFLTLLWEIFCSVYIKDPYLHVLTFLMINAVCILLLFPIGLSTAPSLKAVS